MHWQGTKSGLGREDFQGEACQGKPSFVIALKNHSWAIEQELSPQ
jgi:hypothetical protein